MPLDEPPSSPPLDVPLSSPPLDVPEDEPEPDPDPDAPEDEAPDEDAPDDEAPDDDAPEELPPSAGAVAVTVQPVVLTVLAASASSVAVPESAHIFFVEIIEPTSLHRRGLVATVIAHCTARAIRRSSTLRVQVREKRAPAARADRHIHRHESL